VNIPQIAKIRRFIGDGGNDGGEKLMVVAGGWLERERWGLLQVGVSKKTEKPIKPEKKTEKTEPKKTRLNRLKF